MKNKKFTQLLTLAFAFLAMFSVQSVKAQVVTCTSTGETITINTGDDAFQGEVGWELYNVTTGEVVAYERTGFPLGANQSVTTDVPKGIYELYGYDSFGDGWGGFFGPTFDIEVVWDNQTVCFGDDVTGPGDGLANGGVTCGGNNTGGTVLCGQFVIGQSTCEVTCPGDIEFENDPGECGAFVNITGLTLGSDCVDATNDYNGTSDPSDFYPVGNTEVTVTGFDADGLPDECTFTVTVLDTERPTFANCSNDVTINLDAGECDYIFNFDTDGDITDNCPPSAGACTQANDTVTVDDAFACFIDEFSYMQIFPKDVCGASPTADVSLEFARTGITWLSTPLDVSVNIYGYNQADPFEMANLDLVFTQVETFPLSPFPALGGPSDKHTVNFNSPAIVDGSYDSYVVEMVSPAVGFGNFPFTLNDGGALSDTYWRALNGPNGCGDFEPEEIGAASGGILQGTDWLLVIGASSSFNVTNCGDVEDGDFLEEGVYNVCYEAEDGAGNVGTCEYTITVQNFPNPSQSLACNDHVNVSVDNSCEAIINADMILEGGPYSCYRDYIVQLATDMDFNNIIASSQPGEEGAVVGSAQVGNTYFVRVIDPETGNSCWGTITIEDKFIPELNCTRFPVDCGADITPGTGGASTLVLDDANGEIEIDPFVTGDFPATAQANVAGAAEITNVSVRLETDHTWVGDLSGSVESPSGTLVNLFPQPNCTNTGLDVLFDDAAANTNADFVNTCNNNPAIEGEFQPQDALAAFIGENPDGEWTITINDAAFGDGGTFSVAEIIIDYNFEIPFPFEFTGTATPIDENSFVVSGFDACGDVTASYEDEVTNIEDCDSEFSDQIFRNWTVVDESGNTVTCQDTIDVVRTSLEDLTFPPNFDGTDQPALACDGGNWDLNENGYPDPEETGAPSDQICDNINTTFKDQVIDVCEGTFKVLRTWTFLDWCTSETVTHLQLIKVEDVEGPEIDCPATATISTANNSCVASYSVPDISGNITDECSPSSSFWTVESSAGEVIDFGNQVFQIVDLPVGTHTLTYSADDGCGNIATCEQTLIVQDAVPPVAVCDQTTKVSLGADGTARVFWPTFEDGSYDNCGIDRIEVRRMNREFDCEPTTFFFKEYVEFCCADIDRSPVQVLFRVTDLSGNQNTCMINVNVEDKLPPTIVAPQDLTISCLYPFDEWNLDEFGRVANLTEGEVRETRQIFDEEYERNCLNNNQYDPAIPTYEFQDGFAQDNCTLEVTSDYNDQREDCGTGVIVRTFRAVDDFGNASTAFQRITVSQCSPFTERDIRWPRDRELSCNENGDYSTDPDATGEPVINNNNACSQIAVRYDDEMFEVTPDACFKILRTWTVLDWCQEDANGDNLEWTHTQVIKVNDDQAPELLVCDDVTFCDSSAVGCTGFAELVQEVEDCTPEEFLNISWRVKPFNAGNNPNDDIVGTGLDASGMYPFGTHRITWIIEDMCGNVGTCQYLFTVEDCKQPTPIVINGLATVVMPSSGCIDVDIDLFERGSFDNCGPVDFSYSSDTTDKVRTFCCEDIEAGEQQEVEFWVTDQAGNQDFVVTYILVQDPNEVCPESDSLAIVSGATARSASHGADPVSGVSMKFEDMMNPTPLFTETDGSGEFRFTGAQGRSYELTASKNDDVLNGVNTMDILLIQQHILGLNAISDPYDLIAANVNSDSRISGADLIELRKVILGIETNFPNNDSWRFVDAAEQLEAGTLPVNYSEQIMLTNIPAIVADQDFVAVKIGDVNGSAVPNNLVNQEAEGRSGALVLNAQDAAVESGESVELAVTSEMFNDVLGYQFTLNLNGLAVEGVEAGALDVTEANFGVFEGQMTMSWNAVEAVNADADEVLFTVTLKADQDVRLSEAVQVTSEITATEAYVSNDVRTVDLRFVDGTVKEFALYQNVPNPFESKTIIRFDLPEAGNATLTVFDQAGKVVKEIEGDYSAGTNQVELRRSDINGNGMLYYRLESGDYSAAKKMVIID